MLWQYGGEGDWAGPGTRACMDLHPNDLRETLTSPFQSSLSPALQTKLQSEKRSKVCLKRCVLVGLNRFSMISISFPKGSQEKSSREIFIEIC